MNLEDDGEPGVAARDVRGVPPQYIRIYRIYVAPLICMYVYYVYTYILYIYVWGKEGPGGS
jgi:hypothetical protein